MKYCEEYAALLDLLVDGELPQVDIERVQAHLESCSGCRAYIDDALAVRAGFPDVEDTVVPEDFAAGVMNRIRESVLEEDKKTLKLRRRRFQRWMGTAALAACCALVIILRTGSGGWKEDAAVPTESGYGAFSANNAVTFDNSAESVPEAAASPAVPEEPAEEEEIRADSETPAEAAAEVPRLRTAMAAEDAGESPDNAAMVPAPMMAFQETAKGSVQEAALCLTEEEAGDLLDGFNVVWENAVERHYELSAEEYRTLLESLGRQEELPETADGSFLVVVTGPLE